MTYWVVWSPSSFQVLGAGIGSRSRGAGAGGGRGGDGVGARPAAARGFPVHGRGWISHAAVTKSASPWRSLGALGHSEMPAPRTLRGPRAPPECRSRDGPSDCAVDEAPM